MFSKSYFPQSYYPAPYWANGRPRGGRRGGGGFEEGGVIPSYAPSLAEAIEILRRVRREKEYVLTDEEDAILLLLLSDVFGSIGPIERKVLKDDDDALLLLLANQWPS